MYPYRARLYLILEHWGADYSVDNANEEHGIQTVVSNVLLPGSVG